ncbi:MAG: hypothetical protein JWO81_2660 [Alphaproteobacteria bacterium]|nr:hypothetical protein [Alphaproteobacteria bacterium]
MLGFFRKRRDEALKREALELGSRMMENVNAALDRWKAERLVTRADMMASAFDERLVELEPSQGLTFPELANIDALACLKNWHEQKNKLAAEAAIYLTGDDVQFLDLIEGGPRFTEITYERIDEVGLQLANHIVESIGQACTRRGETPLTENS